MKLLFRRAVTLGVGVYIGWNIGRGADVLYENISALAYRFVKSNTEDEDMDVKADTIGFHMY